MKKSIILAGIIALVSLSACNKTDKNNINSLVGQPFDVQKEQFLDEYAVLAQYTLVAADEKCVWLTGKESGMPVIFVGIDSNKNATDFLEIPYELIEGNELVHELVWGYGTLQMYYEAKPVSDVVAIFAENKSNGAVKAWQLNSETGKFEELVPENVSYDVML